MEKIQTILMGLGVHVLGPGHQDLDVRNCLRPVRVTFAPCHTTLCSEPRLRGHVFNKNKAQKKRAGSLDCCMCIWFGTNLENLSNALCRCNSKVCLYRTQQNRFGKDSHSQSCTCQPCTKSSQIACNVKPFVQDQYSWMRNNTF